MVPCPADVTVFQIGIRDSTSQYAAEHAYCLLHAAGKSAKGTAHHHGPTSGPHAGDRKSKNTKGSGSTKKGKCGQVEWSKQLWYHIMLMLLFLSGSDSRHTVIADAVLLRFLVCIDGDHACAGRPAASAIEFMINCTSNVGSPCLGFSPTLK